MPSAETPVKSMQAGNQRTPDATQEACADSKVNMPKEGGANSQGTGLQNLEDSTKAEGTDEEDDIDVSSLRFDLDGLKALQAIIRGSRNY